MNYKIVADSSSNLFSMKNVSFGYASLKIVAGEREFVDTPETDVKEMTDFLAEYKGKSSTTCPSVQDWIDGFGDAENIFCIAITSGLSGSYNSACVAKEQYLEQYPDRKVFVIDSLSAGPELKLIAEKLEELILKGNSFEEICNEIQKYQGKLSMVFVLESLNNLANNGRVNPAVAKLAGFLGMRLIGKASDKGDLQPLHKVCGEKKTLITLIKTLEELGYKGGKMSISHCFNLQFAEKLKDAITEKYNNAEIEIHKTAALCSFYAEKHGLLIGIEKE